MNCNTTHYRANSSSVPGDPTDAWTYARKELGRFYDRVLSRGRDVQLPAAQSRTLVSLFDQDPPPEVGGMIGPFLDNARQLGKRTAELHLALASDTEDPAFAPEPFSSLYQRQKYQSMRNITGKVLRLLRTRVGTLSEATAKQAQGVLEREEKLYHRFEALLHRRITVMRIRTHGNYHLGQVLFTGKDFVVVDFEGDRTKALSERRRKRTALKDVASMLRSFHYAAFTALLNQTVVRPEDRAMAEPWAHAWTAWTSAVFLRSYLDTAGNAAFVPTDRDELAVLLDIAILEKALAELGFELGQRSERVIVPLQGLSHMLDIGDST